jgi:hypothetical protein
MSQSKLDQLMQKNLERATDFVNHVFQLTCGHAAETEQQKAQDYFKTWLAKTDRLDATRFLSEVCLRQNVHMIMGHHLTRRFPERFFQSSTQIQYLTALNSSSNSLFMTAEIHPRQLDDYQKSPSFDEFNAINTMIIQLLQKQPMNTFLKIMKANRTNSRLIEYYIYQEVVNTMIFDRLTPHAMMMIGSTCLTLKELCQNIDRQDERQEALVATLVTQMKFKTDQERLQVMILEQHDTGRRLSQLYEQTQSWALKKSPNYILGMYDVIMSTFQLFYTLGVMNRLGVTHYDLHPNNIFYQSGNYNETKSSPTIDGNLYIVDETQAFVIHPLSMRIHLFDWDLAYSHQAWSSICRDFPELKHQSDLDYNPTLNICQIHNINHDIYKCLYSLYPSIQSIPILYQWFKEALGGDPTLSHHNKNTNGYSRFLHLQHLWQSDQLVGEQYFALNNWCYLDENDEPVDQRLTYNLPDPLESCKKLAHLMSDPQQWSRLNQELREHIGLNESPPILSGPIMKSVVWPGDDSNTSREPKHQWPDPQSSWWHSHVFATKANLIPAFQMQCKSFSSSGESRFLSQW